MAIELLQVPNPPYIYLSGIETRDLVAGQQLKIKFKLPASEEILDVEVPSDKLWKIRVTVEVFQTDV